MNARIPTAPTPPPDDVLVREALHRSVADVTAPVERLQRLSLARGRRRRRRRRVGLAALACAAVVAVVAVVVPSLGGHAGRPQVATDPTTDLPAPLPMAGPAGWWQIPSSDLLARLSAALPDPLTLDDAVVTNDDRAPEETFGVLRGYVAADVIVGDRAVGGINIVLYPPEPTVGDVSTDDGTDGGGSATASTSPPAPTATADVEGDQVRTGVARGPSTLDRITCPGDLDPAASCAPITDDQGAPVGRTSVTRTGDVTVVEAVLLQDDGGVVYLAVSNSADDKWGEGSSVAAAQAPLSRTQLLDLASDPVWTQWRPRG